MSFEAPYSKKEELLNVISHALGIVFAAFVVWDLIKQTNSVKGYASTLIYGSSLFILFLSSTMSSMNISTQRFLATSLQRLYGLFSFWVYCSF